MDADGKAGGLQHVDVVDVVANGHGFFMGYAEDIRQFPQARPFIDAFVHEFDIAVAGEADRNVVQQGADFSVYLL